MKFEGSSALPEPGKPLSEIGLRNLWRFTAYSYPYWPFLALGFVAGLLRMVLPWYMPQFVKRITDGVLAAFIKGEISADIAYNAFWSVLPLFVALLVMHAIATMGRFYLPYIAVSNAIRDVRYYLFRHLQRLSLSFYHKRQTGAIVSRLMNDVNAAQRVFDVFVIQTGQQLLMAVGIAAYLLYKDWQWALVAFATVPLFVATSRLLRGPMRRASRRQRESTEKISGHVQERLSMIREVQSFTAENYEQYLMREGVETLRRDTLRQQFLGGVLMGSSEITRNLGGMIVLGFGVYRVVGGLATVGDVVAFYMYVEMILRPIDFLSGLYTQLHLAAASADRIFEFFDSDPEIKDAPNAVVLNARSPEVRFENVSFAYPNAPDEVILRDISVSVPPGGRIALVGESGSGKSTLCALIPRFYDVNEGRVLIDNHDVRRINLRSLRNAIGIVPQESVLFTGTIRENIRYGDRRADDEAIQAAARAANAESFILELPQGFDTIVGERGVGLSGGQLQRIAIARAFLRDPAILILDEATSNLDSTSEMLVLEALDRLARGRTTFIIAHRLSTAREADRIVVLRDGAIVEQGTHDELIRRTGRYAEFWERQTGFSPPQ